MKIITLIFFMSSDFPRNPRTAGIVIQYSAVVNNGMNLHHISSYWQKVVIGAIIFLAVILDMSRKKKKA